jgi:hypothetical protein
MMTKTLVACVVTTFLTICGPTVGECQDDPASAVLVSILHDIAALHPGDSEASLEKMFRPDGGLAAVEERGYVSRRCPYVKVWIKFERPSSSGNSPESLIIRSLSRPYVEYPVND